MLLVAGVVLFVLPTIDQTSGGTPSIATAEAAVNVTASAVVEETGSPGSAWLQVGGAFDSMVGITLALLAVTISGFCAIYFERVIKFTEKKEGREFLGIWERNFQLACWSIPSYLIVIFLNKPPESESHFSSWTPLAVVLSLFGCSGGLLVALSIKYGDSVLKTLAISGSIVYAALVDHCVLGGPLTAEMAVAAVVVVIAVFNYTFDTTLEMPNEKEKSVETRRMVTEISRRESHDDEEEGKERRPLFESLNNVP